MADVFPHFLHRSAVVWQNPPHLPISPANRSPGKDATSYLCTMNHKTHWVMGAVKLYVLKSAQYMWCDFGIMHMFSITAFSDAVQRKLQGDYVPLGKLTWEVHVWYRVDHDPRILEHYNMSASPTGGYLGRLGYLGYLGYLGRLRYPRPSDRRYRMDPPRPCLCMLPCQYQCHRI